MQFSWCTLFTKAMPTNYMIRHDFNCHINKRETPITCLTNHKSSISHYIMPLVINSLGDGHTHTHTHIQTLRTKAISETSHAPAFGQCAPGLKSRWFRCVFQSLPYKVVGYVVHVMINQWHRLLSKMNISLGIADGQLCLGTKAQVKKGAIQIKNC